MDLVTYHSVLQVFKVILSKHVIDYELVDLHRASINCYTVDTTNRIDTATRTDNYFTVYFIRLS